jgi:hypothetical protein
VESEPRFGWSGGTVHGGYDGDSRAVDVDQQIAGRCQHYGDRFERAGSLRSCRQRTLALAGYRPADAVPGEHGRADYGHSRRTAGIHDLPAAAEWRDVARNRLAEREYDLGGFAASGRFEAHPLLWHVYHARDFGVEGRDDSRLNLGFSGNGRMEPEVLKFVAELDPAVFVLDCLPNMGAKDVTERTVPGVKILREAHPTTPILLVEDRNYETGFLVQARRDSNEANHAALREAYAALQKEKVPALYYLKADDLLGHDGEGTVDGSHPTDLGFTRQAAEFEKVLRKIL